MQLSTRLACLGLKRAKQLDGRMPTNTMGEKRAIEAQVPQTSIVGLWPKIVLSELWYLLEILTKGFPESSMFQVPSAFGRQSPAQ